MIVAAKRISTTDRQNRYKNNTLDGIITNALIKGLTYQFKTEWNSCLQIWSE
jgi:hypothetical protein